MALPWMPLYVDDYLGATGHLEAHEHGAYMLLIMHYWQRGTLPADEAMIRRIAKLSPAQWAESRDVLAALFEPGWKHKRIDAELADADEKYRRRVERAKAGARGKHASSRAQAEHEQASGEPEAPHMPAQLTTDIEERVTPPKKGVTFPLADRRENAPTASPKQVFVEFESPAWNAWALFLRKQSKQMPASQYSRDLMKNGWWFPSEWPAPRECAA